MDFFFEFSGSTDLLIDKIGRGVAKNYSEAMRFFRKAADLGDTQAMSNIGVMYDNGEGVPKNAAEAARWYKKAADRDKPAR